MSVGLSDYMKIKATRLTKRIVKVAVLLSIFTLTILSIKSLEHKSTIIVDTKYIKCYSNCNEVSLPIEKPSPKEIYEIKKQVEYMKGIERRKVELAKIAEEKRLAEIERIRLVELEAKRIAKQKEKEEAKKKQTVSRGEQSSSNWIVFEATHYSAFCNTGCTGVTALGWNVKNTIHYNGYRVIAVDPSKIKLGSLVEVQTSYGTFKALAGDVGGDIKGHRIDILVKNDNVAYKLGREKVQVRVLK